MPIERNGGRIGGVARVTIAKYPELLKAGPPPQSGRLTNTLAGEIFCGRGDARLVSWNGGGQDH